MDRRYAIVDVRPTVRRVPLMDRLPPPGRRRRMAGGRARSRHSRACSKGVLAGKQLESSRQQRLGLTAE
jgi:hypothetical protein